MMPAAAAVILLGVAFVAIGAVEAARAPRRGSASRYLHEVIGTTPAPVEDEFSRRVAQPFLERVVRPAVARAAGALHAVAPTHHRHRIDAQLEQAGLEKLVRADEIIAAQVVGAALGALAGLGLVATGLVEASIGAVVTALLAGAGGFLPIAWLRRRIDERTDGIRRDLPETLDLLAISVEAGLGLEGAMEVVVEQSSGPLSQELARTLQEMELGVSRREALGSLRHRAHVPELSTFVQALIQADVLGMPLARVLTVQAGEMRTKRRQWARERAGKLPVKIMFPLVGCIFPAVLVVVLGPAVSQIAAAF